VAIALAATVLMWVAGSGSHQDLPDVASAPIHAQSIESVPGLPLLVSDRPALSTYAKLSDAQRGVWADLVIPTTFGLALSKLSGSHGPRLELSEGPVAKGLTGRGPPSFGEP
jgi:hypothetical protein